MEIQTSDVTKRIRELNDRFRMTLVGGVLVTTRSVAALAEGIKGILLEKVRNFENFSEDNDPHQEHDFGTVELDGEKYYFKLDYYDRSMEMASPDPSDPAKTKRVLTIMRSDEW